MERVRRRARTPPRHALGLEILCPLAPRPTVKRDVDIGSKHLDWIDVIGVKPLGNEGKHRHIRLLQWPAYLDLMRRALPSRVGRAAVRPITLRSVSYEQDSARELSSPMCERLAGLLATQMNDHPTQEWFCKHDGLNWRNRDGLFVITESPGEGFVPGCSLSRAELQDWIAFLSSCGGFVVRHAGVREGARMARAAEKSGSAAGRTESRNRRHRKHSGRTPRKFRSTGQRLGRSVSRVQANADHLFRTGGEQ